MDMFEHCRRIWRGHDADPRKGRMTGLYELRDDALGRCDRNRKAHAGRRAGRTHNGGIDPNKTSGGIEQRTTRIPGIDGGVYLYCVRNLMPAIDDSAALQSTDHPCRQRLIEPKRVANCEY